MRTETKHTPGQWEALIAAEVIKREKRIKKSLPHLTDDQRHRLARAQAEMTYARTPAEFSRANAGIAQIAKETGR